MKHATRFLSTNSTAGHEANLPTRALLPSSGSAGSHLLIPAVQSSTARRARPRQGWPSRRPRQERDASRPRLARPSTVLRWQEAVPIRGMALLVQSLIVVSRDPAGDTASARNGYRGSGRNPHGRKPRQRVPSRGHSRRRDSTRPEPLQGRGARPTTAEKITRAK